MLRGRTNATRGIRAAPAPTSAPRPPGPPKLRQRLAQQLIKGRRLRTPLAVQPLERSSDLTFAKAQVT